MKHAKLCVVLVASVVVLSGCFTSWATSERWSNSRGTQEAASQDLTECQRGADAAIQTQASIDQDIQAARGADWEASAKYKSNVKEQAFQTAKLRDRLIGRCMILRGYTIDQ